MCGCCLATVLHIVTAEGRNRASRFGNNVPERAGSGRGELCHTVLIFFNIH